MWKELQRLFVGNRKKPPRLRDEDIDKAIDIVVDSTDPRLRAVTGYRRKLRKPVMHALLYLHRIIQRIPGPFMANHKAYAKDPQLNALFSSADAMQEVFGHSLAVQNFFRNFPASDICFAALAVYKKEKNILGMGLEGDKVIRDVAQTTVNFSGYRINICTASLSECLEQIKWNGLQNLAAIALEKISQSKTKTSELEQQRSLLALKLRKRKFKRSGLEPSNQAAPEDEPDVAQLEQKLLEIEQKLRCAHTRPETLVDYLHQLCEVLKHPAMYVQVKPEKVMVNRMSIKVTNDRKQSAGVVETARIIVNGKAPFEALLINYPRIEFAASD